MKTLFILNDGPYGSERPYNALRLADTLARREGEELRIFLMGDSVLCARAGQKTPNGYYNVERMFIPVVRAGGLIGVCGSCLDARGLADGPLADGAHRGSMEELTDWTTWADKVLVF